MRQWRLRQSAAGQVATSAASRGLDAGPSPRNEQSVLVNAASSHLGDKKSICSYAIRGQSTTGIKTKPTKPEQSCTENRHPKIMGMKGFLSPTFSLAYKYCSNKRSGS